MVAVNYYSQDSSQQRPAGVPTTNLAAVAPDMAEQWLETLTDAEVDELADLLANIDMMLDSQPRKKAS